MLVLAAVFCAALAALSYNLNHIGLAETFVDPVARIPAQDEAVYSSTALHMASSGGWLTPMFLGRYAFYKPPLLYWAVAVSSRLGASLRLPSLLAGAALATLLFAWMWSAHSLAAAIAGTALLVFDRVFFELSRLVLTDMLLLLWIAIALAAMHWKAPWWIAGIAAGLAILTKGVAGFLPLLIILASGAGLKRFTQICSLAALVAAPWHLYQLATHTRWFWAEYILTEHFTWAVATPSQSTQEPQLWYYLRRLWITDRVLSLAALAGAAFLVRERNRLLTVWIAVVLLAFFGFGYRNTSYLVLLIPPLCLVAARAARHWTAASMILIATATQIHKLPYQAEHPLPSVQTLRNYAALQRPNDLIIVAPDDEFVSATLPIRHVRYCFFDLNPSAPPLPLDFRYLGITLTVPEFNNLAKTKPIYAQRLADFGLPSTAPIGTVITARTWDEVNALIAANPASDFFLPGRMIYGTTTAP